MSDLSARWNKNINKRIGFSVVTEKCGHSCWQKLPWIPWNDFNCCVHQIIDRRIMVSWAFPMKSQKEQWIEQLYLCCSVFSNSIYNNVNWWMWSTFFKRIYVSLQVHWFFVGKIKNKHTDQIHVCVCVGIFLFFDFISHKHIFRLKKAIKCTDFGFWVHSHVPCTNNQI